MSLDASLSALGKLELGEGCQKPGRGPALTVGTFGECLPLFAEAGQAQFTQQQRQARSIDGDAVAHAAAPVVADAVATIAGSRAS
jgi:hypothetical protein